MRLYLKSVENLFLLIFHNSILNMSLYCMHLYCLLIHHDNIFCFLVLFHTYLRNKVLYKYILSYYLFNIEYINDVVLSKIHFEIFQVSSGIPLHIQINENSIKTDSIDLTGCRKEFHKLQNPF